MRRLPLLAAGFYVACQVDHPKSVAPAVSSSSSSSTSATAVSTSSWAKPLDTARTDAGASDSGSAEVPRPPRTWSRDDDANKKTLALFERFGVRSDVEHEHLMDGGFRGKIHIVPAEPVGADRKHLEWLTNAYEKMDAWMKVFASRAPEHRYRFTPITLKFFISENRTTPSAYAFDWSIAYNLHGSLLQSQTGVLETFIHETFHLNDQAHNDWSGRTMSDLYGRIRTKCGKSSPCFAPYSPGTTMVRGGTYYAFHAENDVREYAAELMVRFYKETDAAFKGVASSNAAKFKCGPEENKLAWESLLKEFFDGKDVTASCQ